MRGITEFFECSYFEEFDFDFVIVRNRIAVEDLQGAIGIIIFKANRSEHDQGVDTFGLILSAACASRWAPSWSLS